jgi:hypothetical protein
LAVIDVAIVVAVGVGSPYVLSVLDVVIGVDVAIPISHASKRTAPPLYATHLPLGRQLA